MSGEFDDVVAFTFDVDWAPEHILEDLFGLLEGLGAPFTMFATHDSPMVKKLAALPGCETALHPNLQDAKDEAGALAALRGSFPGARGVRVHRLYYHSGLLALFRAEGIDYLSNDLMYMRGGLEPHYDWSGLVRLPIFWEDDVHATVGGGDFAIGGLEVEGMRIFNFHPVHLYLNTSDFRQYARCKEQLSDPDRARGLRNDGPGCRGLFEALVGAVEGQRRMGLGQICEAFVELRPRPPWYDRFANGRGE